MRRDIFQAIADPTRRAIRCKDKYGLSWQVVPIEYFALINSDNPKVRDKAMKNTFSQKKIILSELK